MGRRQVAAAYAISGYVLRLPVLAWLLGRLGPVSSVDFMLVQGLFLLSALAAWVCYRLLPDMLTGNSPFIALASAICLNYGLALLLALLLRQPRQVLLDILSKGMGAIGR